MVDTPGNDKEGKPIPSMSKAFGNLSKPIGKYHNIYFIAEIGEEEFTAVRFNDIMKNFTVQKKGMWMGAEINKQQLIQYTNLAYKDQIKLKKGQAWVSSDIEADSVIKVALPLVRGAK